MLGRIYIIGAGITGLSSACYATNRTKKITIFESSNHPGGRCRSYFDKSLNLEIDNGNHMILSANKNFINFCNLIGSNNEFTSVKSNFYFYNYLSKKFWSINLNKGLVPWWIFNKSTRIPDTNLKDYFSILNFFLVSDKKTVSDLVNKSNKLYKSFWEPLTLGILNTPPDDASAKLLWNVLKESFLKGSDFCKIFQPKTNWNISLINPAMNFLKKNDVNVEFNSLVKDFEIKNSRIKKIIMQGKEVSLHNNDKVIITVPPKNFSKIFPQLNIPDQFNTILNIHFKLLPKKIKNKKSNIFGLIDSLTQWIFIKKDHISVTISYANSLNNKNPDDIIKKVWSEVKECLKISEVNVPEYKILKEKMATYSQSPSNWIKVQKIKNLPENLILSGDWTEKNLPSTIESSILSGKNSINKLLAY